MTGDREPDADGAADGAGDSLDAWMAANFPSHDAESTPVEPPAVPTVPTSVEPIAPETPAAALWPPVPTHGLPAPAPPTTPDLPTTPVVHDDSTTVLPGIPPMAEELAGIPAAVELPPPPTEVFAQASGSSGLDALFGESKFVEYEGGPSTSENPFVRRPIDSSGVPEGEQPPGEPVKSPQKLLLWVAGSLVAVLALVALFILGTKLPLILGPAPGALVSPTMTPTPTPTAVPLGPVAPGEYVWNKLLGGECLDPFTGPWEVKYTVVDCAQPHPAQLVTRGTFPTTEGSFSYPGADALQSQVNLLCTAPTVVDYTKANAYTDIQFEASYAISEQDWFAGNHSYYCFLTRSTGADITGSIAMPQVAPVPAPSEAPAP